MNLASVFARLTGRYMAGALSFFTVSQSCPHTHPGTPGSAQARHRGIPNHREEPPNLRRVPLAAARRRDAEAVECSCEGTQSRSAARLEPRDGRSDVGGTRGDSLLYRRGSSSPRTTAEIGRA